MFNPVSELSHYFLSAIEKYEGNKKYGKQALLDTGEISRNSGRWSFEHDHESVVSDSTEWEKVQAQLKWNYETLTVVQTSPLDFEDIGWSLACASHVMLQTKSFTVVVHCMFLYYLS